MLDENKFADALAGIANGIASARNKENRRLELAALDSDWLEMQKIIGRINAFQAQENILNLVAHAARQSVTEDESGSTEPDIKPL